VLRGLTCAGLVLFACLSEGCAVSRGRASFAPAPLARLQRGVVRAATDPHTWVPLAAAGVVWAAGVDEEVSDWAREHKPLTRFTGDADSWSDWTAGFTAISAAVSSALPLRGADAAGVSSMRAQRAAATGLGIGLAAGSVQFVKPALGRPRPSGGKRNAFPSGHMALSGAAAASWRRNIEYLRISRWEKTLFQGGMTALVALNGWDRIEKGRHFPTDILVGYAYGNFFGILANDLVLGDWRSPALHLRGLPSRDGARVELGLSGSF
jgi:membrane-associated phospholipid phosphatase